MEKKTIAALTGAFIVGAAISKKITEYRCKKAVDKVIDDFCEELEAELQPILEELITDFVYSKTYNNFESCKDVEEE